MSGYQGNEPFNDFIETVHIRTSFWNIFSPDVIITYHSNCRQIRVSLWWTGQNFLAVNWIISGFRIQYGEIVDRKDESGTITLKVISSGGSVYIITRERGTHRTDAILPFQIVVTKFLLWKILSCQLKFQKVIIVIVLEVLRVESNMVILCSSQSSKIEFVFSFRSLQRTQLVDLATYREGLYPLRQRP